VRGLLAEVVGHRGAAADAPENTLASFVSAAEQGVAMVEFDAKLTADGAVILMHDDTLNRTTTGHGAVAAAPLAEIRGLDAGAWFGPVWRGTRVPTLEETIALLAERGLGANIEIKPCPARDAETAEAVVAVVARCWPRERPPPLLSSFSRASLAAARDAAPELPRGLLLWEKPADWSQAAGTLGCRTVHCAAEHLGPEWAAEIKRLGYGLAAYTVNETALAARLRGWGVDSIITDSPGRLLGARPRH
jgi:glycerophosphoryl diester phosphodiesterase